MALFQRTVQAASEH